MPSPGEAVTGGLAYLHTAVRGVVRALPLFPVVMPDAVRVLLIELFAGRQL